MKKTVILSLNEDLSEIQALLDTLNVDTVKTYVQKRSHPHRVSFLGPGRIDEVYEEVKALDLDFVVVNGSLKPSQHHFLEMKFQREFLDRVGVILRIFADHAHTPEAIAQVTLATLRYEQPFLREWIHKAKSGERPGFLAGGAYATDVYFEHAKSHIRRIEQQLADISKSREVRRAERKSKGYVLVALAGYTNAGKTSLMNALCGSELDVDSKLFSTLSTTTRRIPGVRGNVLMTDTVGFMKDLPHDLIDAFESTLEEIYYADLILLVVDASETPDVIGSKMRTCLDLLLPKTQGRTVVTVGNKVDAILVADRDTIRRELLTLSHPHELVMASAVTKEGLDKILQAVIRVQGRSFMIDAKLPLTNESLSLVSNLHNEADIEQAFEGSLLRVTIKCAPDDSKKIIGRIEGVGGSLVSVGTAAYDDQNQVHAPPLETKGPP